MYKITNATPTVKREILTNLSKVMFSRNEPTQPEKHKTNMTTAMKIITTTGSIGTELMAERLSKNPCKCIKQLQCAVFKKCSQLIVVSDSWLCKGSFLSIGSVFTIANFFTSPPTVRWEGGLNVCVRFSKFAKNADFRLGNISALIGGHVKGKLLIIHKMLTLLQNCCAQACS